ncbi:MAG: hypothetical protein B7733_05715 [Myxococcales bacterium FL481]|nr:MAG: hypothetical protein B7733_05715 [Myxococcales bacterium FL481]
MEPLAEEWRGVVTFPGYAVSNYGRVASSKRHGAWRVISGAPADCGDLRARLWGDGIQQNVAVKVLVWEAFAGEVPEGHMVAQRDGDRANCAIWNLMALPTRRRGCTRMPEHEAAGMDAKKREAVALRSTGLTYRQVAKRVGLSYATVYRACTDTREGKQDEQRKSVR